MYHKLKAILDLTGKSTNYTLITNLDTGIVYVSLQFACPFASSSWSAPVV